MEKLRKGHWEAVYQTKDTTKVGWFQPVPQVSIELIFDLNLAKKSFIIDVGGGDSLLVDWLVDQEYEHVTLLDISESALQKAQNRLGKSASKVTWEVFDILEFEPKAEFDLWHDRAVFHFLTEPNEQQTYKSLVERAIASEGYLLVMTFSKSGPKSCSGLPVQQYDVADLEAFFSQKFELIKSLNYDHITPSESAQNYSVCLFRRR
jgi:2-polyprenyl-3-methyl-5-hydroxy-6-metoxy-1,4-benzoquinol methylase